MTEHRSSNDVISAFTMEQASRLSRVSVGQLRGWAQRGFFVPNINLENTLGTNGHFYSFRDLVCLRVLNSLRNEHKIPLRRLEAVKNRLSNSSDDFWAKLTLYVFGRRVVFDNPDTGGKEDAEDGQGIIPIPLKVVVGDMKEEVRQMKQRDNTFVGKIDTSRYGAKRPVIAGTRIAVETIIEFNEAGYSVAQIMDQYPVLSPSDITAAIKYSRAA